MKKLLLALLLVPAVQSVHPSQKAFDYSKTAVGCAVVVALEPLALSYMDKNFPYKNHKLLWTLGGASAGAVAGLCFEKYGCITARLRFYTAQMLFADLDKDLLNILANAPHNQGRFYHELNDYFFNCQYPLADAFKTLNEYHVKLKQAEKLIHKAEYHQKIARQCASLLASVESSRRDVQAAIVTLKCHPHWIDEITNLEAQKNRVAQERIAKAQEDVAWYAKRARWEAYVKDAVISAGVVASGVALYTLRNIIKDVFNKVELSKQAE